MAVKSKANSKKSNGKNINQGRKKGHVSPVTGQKHKSLAELHGITSMVIQPPEIINTSDSYLIELQN